MVDLSTFARKAAWIVVVLVPLSLGALIAFLPAAKLDVGQPEELVDGFTSHRSPTALRKVLDRRGLVVTHERQQDGANVQEGEAVCERRIPSRGETCSQVVEDYVISGYRARLHLFYFEQQLVEVRVYPEDVPGFHRYITEAFDITLFAEHRVVVGQVRIGAHLDSGGAVSYFWQHILLQQALNDWLRANQSS